MAGGVRNYTPVIPSTPIQLEGVSTTARITEDPASIKALRSLSPEQIQSGTDSLLEEIARLKIALEDKDREIEHEGSGTMMQLRHNMIKFSGSPTSINGVDTTGINPALLTGNDVSNCSLVFLNFAVRGVQQSDEALIEIEKSNKAWLHDTSQVYY